MIKDKKPYLIVPKLIEQPTWGGDYILKMKSWERLNDFIDKKIGQSYELFSGTKLLININNSEDKNFIGELGSPDENTIFNHTNYVSGKDYYELKEVTSLYDRVQLIKVNQSNGNSFQIHVKLGVEDKRWQAKPETWYYLEDGLVTYGIKKGIDINEYKSACKLIESEMKNISQQVISKKIDLKKAKELSSQLVKKINPWQYVNLHEIKKHFIVDPSAGGIHHSWEEDLEKYPLGNVLYEVQKDVMDPVSTIRSFDRGKIKSDGSIREVHIDDYFKYLDTDIINNDAVKTMRLGMGRKVIKNNAYTMDVLEVDNELLENNNNSYSHLFVLDGKVAVEADDGEAIIGKGHSCFIPENVQKFKVKTIGGKSVILKTYL